MAVYAAGPAANNSPGRTAEFSAGQSTPAPHSITLEQTSAREQSQVPRGFGPSSVLDAYQYQGYHPVSGNSVFDASRQTPSGQIPAPNSMSMSTWETRNPSLRSRLAIR